VKNANVSMVFPIPKASSARVAQRASLRSRTGQPSRVERDAAPLRLQVRQKSDDARVNVDEPRCSDADGFGLLCRLFAQFFDQRCYSIEDAVRSEPGLGFDLPADDDLAVGAAECPADGGAAEIDASVEGHGWWEELVVRRQ